MICACAGLPQRVVCMSNQTDSKKLAEEVAHIATTIAEIIEVKIKEATASTKTVGPLQGGINMLTPAEGWVGKKAAAEHFNVSPRTFYSWMKNGVIPYVRIGRSVRFKLS